MAQHPTNQDTQDFANLTDSLIPSNIYMSSWGQTDGQKIQDIQSFPFNMFTPSFGSMFPLSNNPGNPSTLSDANNHNTAAFNLNSLQQMDSTSSNEQDREIEAVAASAVQQTQAPATSRSAISDPNDRSRFVRDPLATLKLRAKESVMAKRARSIRSTSNDSKSGNADAHGTNLTENGDHSHGGIVQVEEIDSKDLALSTINVDSVQHLKPPVDIHHAPAKATSAELEDLLAEGRAAASMTGITGNNISNVVEQHERHVDRKQHHRRDVSEVGEIRDDTSHREQELRAPQQSPLKTDRFTASEIDEIDMWLAMTGYYDKAYRDKVLNRRKRLQAIEEERLKLLEEEQEDHRLRGQYHNNTPFCTPQRPTPVVATIQPTPIAKEDLGLRIKNSAPKTRTTPEKTMSSDDLPVKRRIEEEPSDTEAPHQPKIARSEIHRRSPARSKHGSPERHQNRSLSPGKARKQRAGPVSRRQSVHSAEGYDRWVPDNDRDRRGPMDRSLEEHGRRNDNRGRYDQRRDSGLSISHLAKPDFRTGRTRFFLLKSWNYENIATAQREGTWATQVKNEDTFVEAFKTCRHVIFFFSANHSKAFQGYARMQGLPGERGVSQPSWVKNLHWPTTAPFRIRWIVKDETPYRAVGNLKNPLNENLAVFVGRDGQEIPENLGIQLSDIIDEDTAYRADSRR